MARKQRNVQKQFIKQVALNNVKELFVEAVKIFNENIKLANRYVKIALLTRDKSNIKLTKEQKSLFCKKCNSILIPGKNCYVRIKNKHVIYHCTECSSMKKFGLKNKKQ